MGLEPNPEAVAVAHDRAHSQEELPRLPMSQENYLANSARGICPACGFINTDAYDPAQIDGPLEQDGSIAWQLCICTQCGATWKDAYDLIGYYDLRDESGVRILSHEERERADIAEMESLLREIGMLAHECQAGDDSIVNLGEFLPRFEALLGQGK